MLARVLEPEVMDSPEEAIQYDQMDHTHVNQVFVDDFLSLLNGLRKTTGKQWQVFDAGTGTALIPIELIRRGIPATVTANDLAEEMLIVARSNVRSNGMDHLIRLISSDCKQLPDGNETYDAVMANSIVHHIPEPIRVLKELWRILKPDGLFFIRDLARPYDLESLEKIVQTYAGGSNLHQQQLFRSSLLAALTLSEIRELVQEFGISADSVQMTSDRHWTIRCKKN